MSNELTFEALLAETADWIGNACQQACQPLAQSLQPWNGLFALCRPQTWDETMDDDDCGSDDDGPTVVQPFPNAAIRNQGNTNSWTGYNTYAGQITSPHDSGNLILAPIQAPGSIFTFNGHAFQDKSPEEMRAQMKASVDFMNNAFDAAAKEFSNQEKARLEAEARETKRLKLAAQETQARNMEGEEQARERAELEARNADAYARMNAAIDELADSISPPSTGNRNVVSSNDYQTTLRRYLTNAPNVTKDDVVTAAHALNLALYNSSEFPELYLPTWIFEGTSLEDCEVTLFVEEECGELNETRFHAYFEEIPFYDDGVRGDIHSIVATTHWRDVLPALHAAANRPMDGFEFVNHAARMNSVAVLDAKPESKSDTASDTDTAKCENEANWGPATKVPIDAATDTDKLFAFLKTL